MLELTIKKINLSLGTSRMSKMSLILVEDNPVDQDVITRNLSSQFDISACFQDLESLLNSFKNTSLKIPDAILLDLGLPQTFGYETFEQARPLLEKCSVIVVTGNDDERIGQKAIANGAADFIMKDELMSKHIADRILVSLNQPWGTS